LWRWYGSVLINGDSIHVAGATAAFAYWADLVNAMPEYISAAGVQHAVWGRKTGHLPGKLTAGYSSCFVRRRAKNFS
jgi:hypothetical protein